MIKTELDLKKAELELEREKLELERKRFAEEIEISKGELSEIRKKTAWETDRPWYATNLPWLGPTAGLVLGVVTLLLTQGFDRANFATQAEQDRAARKEQAALDRAAREDEAKKELAARKFERESQIILQATDNVTAAQAVRNLDFYLKANLISDPDNKIRDMIDADQAPVTNTQDQVFPPCDLDDTTGALNEVLIKEHAIVGAVFCQTANKGDAELEGGKAEFVVVDFTASGSLKNHTHWLQSADTKASVHILIGQDGTTVQLVPLNEVAWHAGASSIGDRAGVNRFSIGVSLINWGRLNKGGASDDSWNTWTGQSLPSDRVAQLGDTAWEEYSDAQIDALIDVLAAIADEYAIPVENIVSQAEIAPGRKEGPGEAFPWRRVRSALAK